MFFSILRAQDVQPKGCAVPLCHSNGKNSSLQKIKSFNASNPAHYRLALLGALI
jgi:hypothetical protein